MDAILFALFAITLIGYGLQRNHLRQARRISPGSHLAGSSDAIDRDAERVRDELRAAGC